MKKIIALVLAGLVLTGCAQHTQAAAPAPRPGPAVTAAPVDTLARDLATHKAHASLVTMKRHARATAKRKAAARRAREAARIAAQQEAQQRIAGDAGGHHTPTFAERCPNGAATGPQCSTASTRRWADDQAEWAKKHPNG